MYVFIARELEREREMKRENERGEVRNQKKVQFGYGSTGTRRQNNQRMLLEASEPKRVAPEISSP